MRVLIDTNILISAALNPHGTPYKAFLKAVTYPNKGIICDQNIDELRRIFNRKFPTRINMLEKFLAYSLAVIEVAPIPQMESESEKLIRDVKDRPILRAAINAKADVLLTGDKDFLESEVMSPEILTAAEFLDK
ncbi:MAG: putative toxin-antitoxin system toxin component, PIN family [Eubacteriales bacterium]|nr:putative toxin-antitoxin system toxin component, PIN family [Eubacteriales bacterium]